MRKFGTNEEINCNFGRMLREEGQATMLKATYGVQLKTTSSLLKGSMFEMLLCEDYKPLV